MELRAKHTEQIGKTLEIQTTRELDINEIITFLEGLRNQGATHIYTYVNLHDGRLRGLKFSGEKITFEEAKSRVTKSLEKLKTEREEQQTRKDLKEYLRLKEKFGLKN